MAQTHRRRGQSPAVIGAKAAKQIEKEQETTLKPSRIAIDGPAASGKSTIGELLARHLGYLYFDTGVMYRAVTWAALSHNISIEDEAAVTVLAEQLHIDVIPPTEDDGRQYTVLADGEDVTWAIRTPEVNADVSTVSAYPGVRRALVTQQRRVAGDGQVVMVGRDIGTVVLPEAELKLYLDASVEERAQRRWREVRARGENGDYEPMLQSMRRRDEIDSNREASPLRVANNAVVLDTTDLNIEQVLVKVERLIKERECPQA
jgi:cytidylate kinase